LLSYTGVQRTLNPSLDTSSMFALDDKQTRKNHTRKGVMKIMTSSHGK